MYLDKIDQGIHQGSINVIAENTKQCNVYLSMANENVTKIKDYQVLNEALCVFCFCFKLRNAGSGSHMVSVPLKIFPFHY